MAEQKDETREVILDALRQIERVKATLKRVLDSLK